MCNNSKFPDNSKIQQLHALPKECTSGEIFPLKNIILLFLN